MKGFLLAAGLGTRLRPITEKYAKPAVCFLNVPTLYWSYECVRPLITSELILNLHHRPETIRSLTAKLNSHKLILSHETEAPLGSGGALIHAQKHLAKDEDIVVANADEVILPRKSGAIRRLLERHYDTESIATLLTMRHPDAGGKFGGVWHVVGADGSRVLGFGKDASKFPNAHGVLHYVGVLIVNTRILRFLPPSGESNLLYDGLMAAIAAGERVSTHSEDLLWFETGNQKDFLAATEEALPYLSTRYAESQVGKALRHTISSYCTDMNHFTERHNGGLLLSSRLAENSISQSEILDALEQEKAFAVIGSGALIKQAPLNSVVLPGAQVSTQIRNTIAF